MVGFYNYTVYMTYLGFVSGVTGIIFSFDGKSLSAVICLLISGVCDLFDGKIARTKKDRTDEERRFGIQIDSLSDLVCFGVLPGCIGLSLGRTGLFQYIITAFFVLAGLIRLAYFNVTEETRQQNETENRKYYLGVPITSSALIMPIVYFMCRAAGNHAALIYGISLLVLGFLFIAPLKIKKPGKTGTIVLICTGAAVLALMLLF